VTGATGAIGKAIARQIAAHPDFEVVLACRDEAKAERAVREIVVASETWNSDGAGITTTTPIASQSRPTAC